MSDIKVHRDNLDLVLENGDLAIVKKADAIAQHIKQRLRTFLGEWFLDTGAGVPYYEHVNVKNPSPLILDTIFKSMILSTPGVEELLEFDIQLDNATRIMTLVFKVRTIDEEINFIEVLGGA